MKRYRFGRSSARSTESGKISKYLRHARFFTPKFLSFRAASQIIRSAFFRLARFRFSSRDADARWLSPTPAVAETTVSQTTLAFCLAASRRLETHGVDDAERRRPARTPGGVARAKRRDASRPARVAPRRAGRGGGGGPPGRADRDRADGRVHPEVRRRSRPRPPGTSPRRVAAETAASRHPNPPRSKPVMLFFYLSFFSDETKGHRAFGRDVRRG